MPPSRARARTCDAARCLPGGSGSLLARLAADGARADVRPRAGARIGGPSRCPARGWSSYHHSWQSTQYSPAHTLHDYPMITTHAGHFVLATHSWRPLRHADLCGGRSEARNRSAQPRLDPWPLSSVAAPAEKARLSEAESRCRSHARGHMGEKKVSRQRVTRRAGFDDHGGKGRTDSQLPEQGQRVGDRVCKGYVRVWRGED